MLTTKREEVIKQGFCKILWRKLRPRGSLLLEFIHSSGWIGGERLFEFDWEWGEGGRLFGAGLLLTFSAFRMGAYSMWALIRGWALIRINTVFEGFNFFSMAWPSVKTSINCDGCANTVREFLSPKCFMFLMKVFNLTDKILMFLFFKKSALAKFDHLFLKKQMTNRTLRIFPKLI